MTSGRFAVGIPTIVPHGLLNQCMASLLAQSCVRPDVLIIQNGSKVEAECSHWERQGVSVYRPGRNTGVASSWNYACRWAWERGHDAVLLLNDDLVLVDPQTLTGFHASVTARPRWLYFLVGRGFAAGCITKMVWDEVGEFDEGFWPAYYEDNDMHRRMKLGGIRWSDIDLPSEHFGSAAIRMDPEVHALNQVAFPLNQRRYLAKWGGLPGAETYDLPWNGGAPWPRSSDLVEG